MGKEIGKKKQSLDNPRRDLKKSSHSSLRPEHSISIFPHGDSASGNLEPIHGPSSSRIYSYNESNISSGNEVPQRNASIPPLVGQSSTKKYNTSDRPICTPRKICTMPTMNSPVKDALGSNPSMKANFVRGQRDAVIKDLAAEVKDKTQHLSQELGRNQRTKYHHRYLYQIAYKEFSVPYYKIGNIDDMITVIIDAVKSEYSIFCVCMYSNKDTKALLYLHEVGWVHRDISVGNLYLYTDPVNQEKRGLIGDLEYTKRVGEGGKHDVRIVRNQRYFLTPQLEEFTMYLGNS